MGTRFRKIAEFSKDFCSAVYEALKDEGLDGRAIDGLFPEILGRIRAHRGGAP